MALIFFSYPVLICVHKTLTATSLLQKMEAEDL